MRTRGTLDKLLSNYSVNYFVKKNNIDNETRNSLLKEGSLYFYFVLRFVSFCSIAIFLVDIINLLFSHPFYIASDQVELSAHILNFVSHVLFFVCSILFSISSFYHNKCKHEKGIVVIYYFSLLASLILFKVGEVIDPSAGINIFYSGYVILALFSAFPILFSAPFLIYNIIMVTTLFVFALPPLRTHFEYQELVLALALSIISSFFRTHYFKNFYLKFANEQKNQALSLEAKTDILTEIYNRRALNEFAENIVHPLIGDNKNISILFFDIDNFKSYNDNYSYETGDEVLKIVSKTIKDMVYSNDNIHFFRFGGDEFVLVFLNLDENFIKLFISQLLKSTRNLKLKEAGITISVGASSCLTDADYNFFNHLAISSEKMRTIKQSGKNHALFNDLIIK